MEAAVGAASWLLGKVRTKLSDGMVSAYVDSLELGHNSEQIRHKLLHTQGLLEAAQGRDVKGEGLQILLADLSKKADEAEDLLDELHYFKIQDDLDDTNDATTQEDLGNVFRDQALHVRQAFCHTVGNLLQCFSCWPTQDDDSAVASNPHYTTTMSASGNHGDHADKLRFDRANMSQKIKSVTEDIHSQCGPVSDLLKITNNSTTSTLARPQTGAAVVQDTLYGRRDIFEKTVDDITSRSETLSVLPVVGPGGIGKTTFTQHLLKDARIKVHFTVRVWVCVSTDFDVLKLTQEILGCIPATENEGINTLTNLSKLQETIAQRLKSKRFLIVLDDIWKCDSEDEWKTLLAPFKNGEANGNMVLVTTRFPKLAQMMKTIDPIELQGLESNDFFTFFEACIFGDHKKPRHYEDELAGIAGEIANKLKGSPLAAKTVGRLLQKDHSQEHWNEVLQKHKWLNQQNNDDILPSLKISYSYLPFDLQKCFSFCALFPEDHRFNNLEINRFWIAIGIIDFSHLGDKNYLEELVENGFLMKGVDYKGRHYYVMHDLMHELSRSVSKQECINISDLNFRADDIPKSIRHLSITIENKYDEKFGKEMDELKKRIDIVNLRTLMIFREYEERVAGILRDTFKDINGLRVLFIAVESLDYLPPSFSKLIHLQYLKIESSYYNARELTLPSTLSRFYHLKFLDLEGWWGGSSLPEDISRLVNLRDFLANKELHSNVPEVGKMKHIQELKKFHVKKEMVGFELKQLGGLEELGGELTICNLENVATKEEASEAELNSKENLKELTLVWGREQPIINADVLDGLQPHPNLRALGIINHGGTTGPSWLCLDIWVSLETLHLEDVSWGTLPPLGQLPHLKELFLKRISGVRQFGPDYGGITGKCFMHLKKVVFDDLPELVEWVVEPNCHSFPKLESIQCSGCPNLCVMPFSECSCANLCRFDIDGSSKLVLPPMPHTSTLTEFTVRNRHLKSLSYHGKRLEVSWYDGALAFHNLDKVEEMSIADVSHISLSNLEKLKSLRKLKVQRCDSMFSEELDGSVVSRSVQSLRLDGSHLTRKLLSNVFSFFPALAELYIENVAGDQEEQVLQFPSSSSLKKLTFFLCKELVLVPAEDGGGIQDMMSLQSLRICGCGKLFSRWPMGEAGGAQTINPFPASLRELYIDVVEESSMQSMAMLSNLTSLTRLRLTGCENLTVDGFNPLITVNLKELVILNQRGNPSVAADLLSEVARTKLMPSGSFQLEELRVDSISAVLVAPICNLLAATLHTLEFHSDMRAEGFTEEQEKALQLLTSLQNLEFDACEGLQSLPQGLHRLSSLKELRVYSCDELRLVPKEGFPTSLQKLIISNGLKEQVQKLKERYPDLHVECY